LNFGQIRIQREAVYFDSINSSHISPPSHNLRFCMISNLHFLLIFQLVLFIATRLTDHFLFLSLEFFYLGLFTSARQLCQSYILLLFHLYCWSLSFIILNIILFSSYASVSDLTFVVYTCFGKYSITITTTTTTTTTTGDDQHFLILYNEKLRNFSSSPSAFEILKL
jgi:hypothetical protein